MKLYIKQKVFSMSGNFLEHEYEVTDGAECVMRLSKHWFTWGDSYELDIPRPENDLPALCVALAVDCMNADARDAAAIGSGD